jgi:hypothetical protein
MRIPFGIGRDEVAAVGRTRQDVPRLEAETDMKLTLPLDAMTTAEKLRALEEIWADLQGAPEELPSPAWHADVLAARERRVREGTSRFSDWETAKARIREKA